MDHHQPYSQAHRDLFQSSTATLAHHEGKAHSHLDGSQCSVSLEAQELAYYPSSALADSERASNALHLIDSDGHSLSNIVRYHSELSEDLLRRTSTWSGSTFTSSSASSESQHGGYWSAAVSPFQSIQDEGANYVQHVQPAYAPCAAAPDYFAQTPSPPAMLGGEGQSSFDFYAPNYSYTVPTSQPPHSIADHLQTPCTARYTCTFGDCNWATDDRQLLKQHLDQHARSQVHYCFVPACYKHFTSRSSLELHSQQDHIQDDLCRLGNRGFEQGISPFSAATQSETQSYFEPRQQAVPVMLAEHNAQLVGLGLMHAADTYDDESSGQIGGYGPSHGQHQEHRHSIQFTIPPAFTPGYPSTQLQQLHLATASPVHSRYPSAFPTSSAHVQPGVYRRSSDADIMYGHVPSSLGGLAAAPNLSALHEQVEDEESHQPQTMATYGSSLSAPDSLISLASAASNHLIDPDDHGPMATLGLGLMIDSHELHHHACPVYETTTAASASVACAAESAQAEGNCYSSPVQLPASAPMQGLAPTSSVSSSAHVTLSNGLWQTTMRAAEPCSQMQTPTVGDLAVLLCASLTFDKAIPCLRAGFRAPCRAARASATPAKALRIPT